MPGILDGIRVFDLSIAAVGPWAAKLLGELGADVIKVEAPEGELAHYIPPPIKGTAVLYLSANFNKRHIVLDLKQEGDRALALKIIAKSDVFIQNMRPGAVERLGLGYDVVSHVNPKIVYVAASAYGRTGPMAREAGVDPTVQAFSGWCSMTGQPGSQGSGGVREQISQCDDVRRASRLWPLLPPHRRPRARQREFSLGEPR